VAFSIKGSINTVPLVVRYLAQAKSILAVIHLSMSMHPVDIHIIYMIKNLRPWPRCLHAISWRWERPKSKVS